MPRFVYALLCIVIPMAWGLVVVFFSNRIDSAIRKRRKQSGRSDEPLPPIEFHI